MDDEALRYLKFLENRVARLRKLTEMNAPPEIIEGERQLCIDALYRIGDQCPHGPCSIEPRFSILLPN